LALVPQLFKLADQQLHRAADQTQLWRAMQRVQGQTGRWDVYLASLVNPADGLKDHRSLIAHKI